MMSLWLGMLAQLTASAPGELTFDEFHRRVAKWHPVARQAQLLDRVAAGTERSARGAFDPKLSAAWDRKRLGGTSYFDYFDARLEVPTPFGADLYVGYERARGAYLAPDRRTPAAGLVSAGIKLPLGQRLLVDERRGAIAQARAMRDVAAGERDAMVNKLLATATTAYASWFEAVGRLQLTREAVEVAAFRLDALRHRVRQGDAAAIDTLEAGVEWQRRRLLAAEAEVESRNAALLVEAMLWDERGEPLPMAGDVRPQAPGTLEADSARVNGWIAAAIRRHPDVRKAAAKVQEKEVEAAIAQQRVVVPDLQLSIAGLAPGQLAPGTALDAAGSGGDFKAGGSVEVPVWLRKARGKLESSEGVLDQVRLERELTRRTVVLGVLQGVNELRALDEMVVLQEAIVAQARRLREGEQRRFDAGESTLFLVNTRERAVIDEELKLLALRAKRLTVLGKLGVTVGEPVLP